jgi:heme exporter protein B|tara:strand:- start:1412 stop:2071 length:660 start_codon:yes stop_codon:yes gene_type:complete
VSPLAALVRKEVRVELRSLQGTVAAAMLVLALLLLLRFTLTNDEIARARLAPAILWSVLLFAGLGLLTHTALREGDRGTGEMLRLAPLPRATLFLGAWAGNLLLLSGLTLLAFGFYILLFENSFGSAWPSALAILLLSAVGVSAAGTLTTQAAAPLPGAWMLGTLLAIPLLLFTVVEASLRALQALLLDDAGIATALTLLLLYDLAFLAGGAWLSELAD